MNSPSMEEMALELSEHTLCKNSCRRVKINWDTFPDGFPNVFIDEARSIAGKSVVLLLSFYHKTDLFEQLAG